MKICFFPEGDENHAPSRHRVYIYLKYLRQMRHDSYYFRPRRFQYRETRAQWSNRFNFFFKSPRPNRLLSGLMTEISRLIFFFKNLFTPWKPLLLSDKIVFHRCFPPVYQKWALQLLRKDVYFDFDDALFLKRPPQKEDTEYQEGEEDVHFKNKMVSLIKQCKGAIVSNDYLAEWTRRYNPNVFIIPTSIEIDERFLCSYREDGELILGWTGAPENQKYLMNIYPALERILDEYPKTALHCITSHHWDFPHPRIRKIKWKLKDFKHEIQRFSIGLAPLTGSPWTQGKMQFRAIECASQGVPVVASPVGFDLSHWKDNENILLARTSDEFYHQIRRLVESETVRKNIGLAGLKTIRRYYHADVNVRHLAAFILK